MPDFPISWVRLSFPALNNADDFVFFDNGAGAQDAAAWLGRLGDNGVPHRALGISTLGMIAAILLAIWRRKMLSSCSTGPRWPTCFSCGIVILLTLLRFRRGHDRMWQREAA